MDGTAEWEVIGAAIFRSIADAEKVVIYLWLGIRVRNRVARTITFFRGAYIRAVWQSIRNSIQRAAHCSTASGRQVASVSP